MIKPNTLLSLLFLACFCHPVSSETKKKSHELLIDSDFGEKLKKEKHVSLVVLQLTGRDVIDELKKGLSQSESKNYAACITLNEVEIFDGVIEYKWIGGSQKILGFRTKDRYLYLKIGFPELNLAYSGIVDVKKKTIIEVSLFDDTLTIESFKGPRAYE